MGSLEVGRLKGLQGTSVGEFRVLALNVPRRTEESCIAFTIARPSHITTSPALSPKPCAQAPACIHPSALWTNICREYTLGEQLSWAPGMAMSNAAEVSPLGDHTVWWGR